MNFKKLSSQELHDNLLKLVETERNTTLEILHHLAEIETRMFYAQLSYSSLFEYCTEELRYSAAKAQRRISAMRLLREIPQVEPQLAAGAVTVSQLSQLASFFRTEQSVSQTQFTPTQKLELTQSMAGLSTRETERALLARSPTYHSGIQPRTAIRAITNELTEIKLVVDQKFVQLLEATRAACAHNRDMNPKPQDLLKRGLELLLTEQQKKRGFAPAEIIATPQKTLNLETNINRRAAPQTTTLVHSLQNIAAHSTPVVPTIQSVAAHSTPAAPSPQSLAAHSLENDRAGNSDEQLPTPSPSLLAAPEVTRSRYLPIQTKRTVAALAQNQCEFTSPSGIRCTSNHALEFHHDLAYAKGGQNSAQNLKLFCRTHNSFDALLEFGPRPR